MACDPPRSDHYGAQHGLTLAYASADAADVLLFDDLKLFSNILVSWIVSSVAPDMTYWPGILMVFAGSAYLLWSERARPFGAALA